MLYMDCLRVVTGAESFFPPTVIICKLRASPSTAFTHGIGGGSLLHVVSGHHLSSCRHVCSAACTYAVQYCKYARSTVGLRSQWDRLFEEKVLVCWCWTVDGWCWCVGAVISEENIVCMRCVSVFVCILFCVFFVHTCCLSVCIVCFFMCV